MAAHDPRWTLAELADELSRALSATALVPADARAREVPDARTIRYYTTLGLLDRPAELRGRTAFYGRRHLAQLVAIKRLQAEGRTLAEVQERLAGLTARGLSALAALPAAPSSAAEGPAADQPVAETPASPAVPKPPAAPAASRPRFWATSPAASSSSSSSRASEPSTAIPACALAVSLEPGVQLLFTPSRALTAADLDALRAASAQVLALLSERGLVPTLTERGLPTHGEPRQPTHGERGLPTLTEPRQPTHGERGQPNPSLASLTFPQALAESAPSSDDPEEGAPR